MKHHLGTQILKRSVLSPLLRWLLTVRLLGFYVVLQSEPRKSGSALRHVDVEVMAKSNQVRRHHSQVKLS